jgi:peptidoglycan/xylan/chitin deacetylase (PgdA/CDA1 family)
MKTCNSAEPFVARGFRRRVFFPHEAVAIRKAYPDTHLHLKRRGIPAAQAARLEVRQLNLYSPWIEDFPPELFTDSVVNWHNQQFGRPGLVASAGLFIEDGSLRVSLLQSDLCQQIARNRRLKETCASRVNNRFRYWYEILHNAILDFAVDLGLQHVYSPTADQIVRTTLKPIDPALFFQIYDSCRSRYEVSRELSGSAEYWRLNVANNADRIVRLQEASEGASVDERRRVICIYHDIEENVDTDVTPEECHAALVRMLEVEREHGVRTTYNVLGRLFARKAPLISASAGHSIAFHTYDHNLDSLDQLPRLRGVDLQVKGYRTARSVITEELTDYALNFHNFEWLMSSAKSYGFDLPRLEHGLVKIPAHLDDYPLSTGAMDYEGWMNRVLTMAQTRRFVSIGLHDCYSKFWIERYSELLNHLKRVGELWTCDQIAGRIYLTDAASAAARMRSNVQAPSNETAL